MDDTAQWNCVLQTWKGGKREIEIWFGHFLLFCAISVLKWTQVVLKCQVPYVGYWFKPLWDFFGDLLNYTFLERLLPNESENQCFHFFRCVYGSHIWMNKMATVKCMFFHILASKWDRSLILMAKPTFTGSRNPMVQVIISYFFLLSHKKT